MARDLLQSRPMKPASSAVLAPEGARLLDEPGTNKGTAYTLDERGRLAIDGLLPPRVETLAEQAARVVDNVRQKTSPLEKYRYRVGG